jgi:PEP-CTERM motif
MKISRIFAVAILLAVGSVMALADGINDPQVIIHGVGGNGSTPLVCPPGGCVGVGVNFSFSVPPNGSGTLYFTNTSGVNWNSLALIEQGHAVPAADIKCRSYLFTSCTATTLRNGNVEILLSNGGPGAQNRGSGIRAGANFAISFSCVNKSCWPGGLSFGGHANPSATVPEPGTIALMVTGLGALVSRRKMWKNRWNS